MGLKFNVNKYVADRGQTRINRGSVDGDTTTYRKRGDKKTYRSVNNIDKSALTKANREFLRFISCNKTSSSSSSSSSS